mmetsp:Transcript_39274/g.78675  ORF Transcript_39274/g.78675 Transcript_39274/m.78675 type:complete len:228 (-) Transcript_39274:1418-2101(-)
MEAPERTERTGGFASLIEELRCAVDAFEEEAARAPGCWTEGAGFGGGLNSCVGCGGIGTSCGFCESSCRSSMMTVPSPFFGCPPLPCVGPLPPSVRCPMCHTPLSTAPVAAVVSVPGPCILPSTNCPSYVSLFSNCIWPLPWYMSFLNSPLYHAPVLMTSRPSPDLSPSFHVPTYTSLFGYVQEPLPLRSSLSHSPRYDPASPLSVSRPIPPRLSSLKHPTYTSPFG